MPVSLGAFDTVVMALAATLQAVWVIDHGAGVTCGDVQAGVSGPAQAVLRVAIRGARVRRVTRAV